MKRLVAMAAFAFLRDGKEVAGSPDCVPVRDGVAPLIERSWSDKLHDSTGKQLRP